MPDHRVSAETHERIFGKQSATGERPGRRRYYINRFTDDITERGTEGHNLRERPPPRASLAAPQLAPKFEAFRPGVTGDWGETIINDRREKRSFMDRNDLVEFDEGVTNEPTWVEERAEEAEVVETIRRFRDTDTDYYGPEHKAVPIDEEGSLDEGTEIDTTEIEVIK